MMPRIINSVRTSVKLLVIGVCCLAGCVLAQCPQPTNIIGNKQRSPTYVYKSTPLCDFELDDSLWYSFKTTIEYVIPELETVATKHCGTFGPIFIKAKATGQTYHEDAKASANGLATAPICSNNEGENSPCDWKTSITIRYCPPVGNNPEFYLYKLRAPPTCELAYCAVATIVCKDGTVWNDAKEKCDVSQYPIMTPPTLVGPEIVEEKNVPSCDGNNLLVQRFAFFCDIGYPQQAADDNSRFVIKLVFNGEVADNIVINDATSQNIRVEISETLLVRHMGQRLCCEVSSYWSNVAGTGRSAPLRSDSYWLQIQIPPKEIDLNKPNGKNEFKFDAISSLPITCWHCANIADDQRCQCCRNKCSYSYYFSTRFNNAGCDLVLNNDNGPQTDLIAGNLKVQLQEDCLLNQHQNYLIDFLPYNQNQIQCPVSIWKDYQMPPINIRVIGGFSHPLCCMYKGDPHVTHIFGPTRSHNYLLGDFTLASVYDPANKMYMMIQVRQVACDRDYGSCACGVIVREGNSVLGVNACINGGGEYAISATRIIRYLETRTNDGRILRDGSSIYRDSTGTKYTILMGSGMRVDVLLGRYFDIYIKFPPKYTAGIIGGMCVWTDKAHNGERYRLSRGSSLFVSPPQCLNWDFETATDCNCDQGVTTCPKKVPPVGTAALVQPGRTGFSCTMIPSRRRRRQATEDESPSFEPSVTHDGDTSDDIIDLDKAFADYQYDPDHGKDVNPTWPTATGKTEQQVADYCLSVLKRSAVYDKCQGLYDEEEFLGDCKLDVQITDNNEFADPYLDMMEKICIDKIILEANATSREELEQDPSYSDIANNICPSQCNQRGTCQNGACTCNEGFVGADCSVVQSDPPKATRIIDGNGTCSLLVKKCAKLRVIASNTYDSAALTCRFQTFSLLESQAKDFQSETIDTQGTFYAFSQIDCPTPESQVGKSTGYRVSISNDGVLFSNDKQFSVYDPTCLTRADDGTWQLKPDTCLWNGTCFPQSSPNCPLSTSTEEAAVTTPESANTPESGITPFVPEVVPSDAPTEPPVVEPTTTTQTTTATTTTATPGETFNCDTNNPCTLKNILLGKFFFPTTNPNQYIQCTLLGKCSILRCLLGLLWSVPDNKCILPLK